MVTIIRALINHLTRVDQCLDEKRRERAIRKQEEIDRRVRQQRWKQLQSGKVLDQPPVPAKRRATKVAEIPVEKEAKIPVKNEGKNARLSPSRGMKKETTEAGLYTTPSTWKLARVPAAELFYRDVV